MNEPNEAILKHFLFNGKFESIEDNKSGLINSTYILNYIDDNSNKRRYILQSINTNIFKNPLELMQNIYNVTEHIKSVTLEKGKDASRITLTIIKTTDDKFFYKDADGVYWRAYNFIEGAVAYNKIERKEHFFSAGVALGQFQKNLENYPIDKLYETIANFHNTPMRFKSLCKAIAENKANRRDLVACEIKFFEDREDFYSIIIDEMSKGTIPLRVTHNDTKINNVMIDTETEEAVCLIDLDTVMPGSALYDFGDSIRFGTNTTVEDDSKLENVKFNEELFASYTQGYLSEMKENLTDMEIMLLPESAILMTLECGMRFLTDYLEGDVYFGISRENHNIDRARNQIKLAIEMENNIEKMRSIVKAALDK